MYIQRHTHKPISSAHLQPSDRANKASGLHVIVGIGLLPVGLVAGIGSEGQGHYVLEGADVLGHFGHG